MPAVVGIPVVQHLSDRSSCGDPAPPPPPGQGLEGTAAGVPSPDVDDFIQALRLPAGVVNEFKRSKDVFPTRTWIVDNSGSMATADGHRILKNGDGREVSVPCTRWEELSDAILWHGALAAHLGAPTEFRLLNHPGLGHPQVVTCGVGGSASSDISTVQALCTSGPTGRTPLCEHIRAVTAVIRGQAAALRAAGKRHVLVLASDGLATDGNVAEALRALQDLPVWVVVRLCTDEAAVVSYWNDIDAEVELELEVLDDLTGEAREVCSLNPWLNYAVALHRLREWGCPNKIFDLLDETKLSHVQMRDLLALILGEQLPHPQADYAAFEQRLVEALKAVPAVFDPLRKRNEPWVNLSRLRSRFGANKSALCVVS